jgi:hypothetical protein
VAGGYGFTITGTLLFPTPVPLAAVGKALLSRDGSFSATEVRSVGGGFANETLKGTFAGNRSGFTLPVLITSLKN